MPALREAVAGTRVALGLKVLGTVKNQLDQAARENGRTQSSEAEVRLENSFRDESLIDAAAILAHGERGAGFLRLCGEIVRVASEHATYLKALAGKDEISPEEWMDDPVAFEVVERSLRRMLKALRPGQRPKTLPAADGAGDLLSESGNAAIGRPNRMLVATARPDAEFDARARPIAKLLGAEVVARIERSFST